jgi:beta-phosphoglucomutase-like phosphatase (HAD superfamily)
VFFKPPEDCDVNQSTLLQALVFDVDGTLADTESVHLAAFNHAFSELGMGWIWNETLYTELLNVSGGKERILHYWKQSNPDVRALSGSAVQDTIDRIHALKTAHYEAIVHGGGVALRPGVLALIYEAIEKGLRLTIATTTSPVNIAALLRSAMGADWRMNFVAIGDASTAPIKKPHPQVYLQMLQALQLPAQACLAFEDSGNGLQAATAAGLPTIITPTHYTLHHDFSAALRVVPDLSNVDLAKLTLWHQVQKSHLDSH